MIAEQVTPSEFDDMINDILRDEIEKLGITEYVAKKAKKIKKRRVNMSSEGVVSAPVVVFVVSCSLVSCPCVQLRL